MRFCLMACLCVSLAACTDRQADTVSHPAAASSDALAVSNTMWEARNARDEALVTGGKKNPSRTVGGIYLDGLHGLHSISTTNCPQKFRVAFLDYVHTCERANTGDISPNLQMVAGMVKANGDAMQGAKDQLSKRDIPEAWRRLESAALEFGVGR